MIPLWSSRPSFTIGISVLAELISWRRRWFSSSPCDSFSWAWSSLSRSSSSCLFSSATSLMQASCSGGGTGGLKWKSSKNEIKRLTHSDYQTQNDASVTTDLPGQPAWALVASRTPCCQLRCPNFFSSAFLCGELPLHTACQPPVAQSDTWPLQGHHLFSSTVVLMDNFPADEKLYKSCTVYYAVLWHSKQWQCGKILIINHKEIRCVGFFFLTFWTDCNALNEQVCRCHWFRIWVPALKPALKGRVISSTSNKTIIKHTNDFTLRSCCTGVCDDKSVGISQTAIGGKVQNKCDLYATCFTSDIRLPVDTNFARSFSALVCVQRLYPRKARDCWARHKCDVDQSRWPEDRLDLGEKQNKVISTSATHPNRFSLCSCQHKDLRKL